MTVFDSWMNLVRETSWKKRFKRDTSTYSVYIGIKFNKIGNNPYKTRSGHLIDRWTSLEHAWLVMIEYIHYNIIDFLKVLLS